jgi:hypothetical protein
MKHQSDHMTTFIRKQNHIGKHVILLRVNHLKMIDHMYFNCKNFVLCYSQIYVISHRKSVKDINRWSGGR